MASEIEKIGDTPLASYDGALDFNEALKEGADVVRGSDLVSGKQNEEILWGLIGVPFAITRVVFRAGTAVNTKDGVVDQDYVSCECIMADMNFMQQRKVNISELPAQLWPGNKIVFNDGSTGIKRQIVEYLMTKGWIKLPQPLVLEGARGEHSFDLPVDSWEEFVSGEVEKREDGSVGYARNFNPPLICPRGLRKSDYPNPANPKERSITLYLG
jgi:hypothetical protein